MMLDFRHRARQRLKRRHFHSRHDRREQIRVTPWPLRQRLPAPNPLEAKSRQLRPRSPLNARFAAASMAQIQQKSSAKPSAWVASIVSAAVVGKAISIKRLWRKQRVDACNVWNLVVVESSVKKSSRVSSPGAWRNDIGNCWTGRTSTTIKTSSGVLIRIANMLAIHRKRRHASSSRLFQQFIVSAITIGALVVVTKAIIAL